MRDAAATGVRRRLLVICPYPEGVAPGQRLKYEQYFGHMRAAGYEITISPFISSRLWDIVYSPGRFAEKAWWTLVGYARRVRDLSRVPRFDAVYVHLWVTPFGPPIFEALLCLLSRRVIYDIDDMVFEGHVSAANRFIRLFKGRAKMIHLMRCATHVITCTPALDEVARKYNTNTSDISSTIDTDTYIPRSPTQRRRRLTLGWSGSHSTSKYLLLLEDVLRELRQTHEFDVLVIGDPSFTFRNLECEAIPWSRDTEVRDLQRIDIGLYPLPRERWVLGKSGLKALQYMALAIPTIATAIGANFRVIENGVSGLLVDGDAEWCSALTRLLEDDELRRRLGAAGRDRVERHFSVRATSGQYLAVLDRVMSMSPHAR